MFSNTLQYQGSYSDSLGASRILFFVLGNYYSD